MRLGDKNTAAAATRGRPPSGQSDASSITLKPSALPEALDGHGASSRSFWTRRRSRTTAGCGREFCQPFGTPGCGREFYWIREASVTRGLAENIVKVVSGVGASSALAPLAVWCGREFYQWCDEGVGVDSAGRRVIAA